MVAQASFFRELTGPGLPCRLPTAAEVPAQLCFREVVRHPAGGWTRGLGRPGWSCLVDQGHYGHAAQKPTWLYFVGKGEPPALVWGPSSPPPLGSGARRGNLESMSKLQRAATPGRFADALIVLARGSR